MSDFLNQIAFDKQAKEYVLLTNGVCRKRHDTPEGYKQDHTPQDPECRYAPSEAIALRCLGMENGKPIIGWTYRKVDADSLSSDTAMQCHRKDFDTVLGKKAGKYFIGRV